MSEHREQEKMRLRIARQIYSTHSERALPIADRIIEQEIAPLHGRLAALLAECETVLGEYTTDFERDMDSVHRADALLAKLKARTAEGGDA
jgi:hypothetical protein